MHPILFKYQWPEFLQQLFGVEYLTIYSYAFCIVVGALCAAHFAKYYAKKEGMKPLSNNFFYIIFIAGFVGGKLFLWLEDPKMYLENPSLLLDLFSGGFVFYGSLVTAIPVVVWYLKANGYELMKVLDIMSITTVIAHAFGRLGCFLAGCCYGKTTTGFLGIEFPLTHGEKVIPTQLIEMLCISTIGFVLYYFKRTNKFSKQLFFVYLILYGTVRFFLEFLRGDKRGVILEVISHAQFTAIILILVSIFILRKIKLNIHTKTTM